jgi:hypothetical protein
VEHFYQGIEGWFTFEEFYRWACRRVPPPLRVTEVGVYQGRSAAFLGVELLRSNDAWGPRVNETHPTVTLVDTFPWQWKRECARDAVLARLAPLTDAGLRLEALEGPSVEMAKRVPDGSQDLVFIDADHNWPHVRDDIEAWTPKVTERGILAGHDYCAEFPAVLRAVTEAFPRVNVWRGSEVDGQAGRYHPVWWLRPHARD